MRKRTMGASHSSSSDLSSIPSQRRDMPGVAIRDIRKRESRDDTGEALAVSHSTQQSTGEIPVLPQEVVEEIFLNLPPNQVVHSCRLVCREWKEIVDSEALWIERCRREGYHLRDGSKRPEDWRLFYFLCKKRRNLLKNPKAEENLIGWKILENGGDKWRVEGVMVPHPDDTVQRVFVTSYGMCRKSQLINLEKEGYNPSFMDHFQPDIKISEWYVPRWDCGCEYQIRVELLGHRKRLIRTFAPDTVWFSQWNDQKWNQVTHVFQNYGPGVRYIHFIHGGKDSQFWAGWYGIRITDSQVEICPSEDP